MKKPILFFTLGLVLFACIGALQTDTIVDSQSIIALNINSRQFYDSTGVNSLNLATRALFDSGGSQTVDWDGEVLYTSALTPTVDWGNKQLLEAGDISVDWHVRQLKDDALALSLDWENRYLTGTWTASTLNIGTLVVTNYLRPSLFASTNGVTDGMTLSFDHGTNKYVPDLITPSVETLTNFVLNTVYTNGAQTLGVRASVTLTEAAVSGVAELDLMVDRAGGSTFALLGKVAQATTVTLNANLTDTISGIVPPNGTYYFTNTSTGSGNSAALVAGSGQRVTMSSGTNGATGATGAQGPAGPVPTFNSAQFDSGGSVTNIKSGAYLTNITIYGDNNKTNWVLVDTAGWHNTNNSAANQGVNISQGTVTAQAGFTGNGVNVTNVSETNIVATVFTFASVTNAVTLNRALWNIDIAANGSLTNVVGTGFATLRLSNSSGSSVTFYITNTSWRTLGQATTNFAPSGALAIPAGKVARVFLDNRIGGVEYGCVLQQ